MKWSKGHTRRRLLTVRLIIALIIKVIHRKIHWYQGRIQDFKLGRAHLSKLRRAKGGTKIFGVFRVKIHDFTQKKQITESPSYP
jgi:hypothetical protein